MSLPAGQRTAARVGTVLREATRRFREAGIATARQDAELLLARTLGATRLALHLAPERAVEPETLVRLETLLARRAGHEPLQYILGADEFLIFDPDHGQARVGLLIQPNTVPMPWRHQ